MYTMVIVKLFKRKKNKLKLAVRHFAKFIDFINNWMLLSRKYFIQTICGFERVQWVSSGILLVVSISAAYLKNIIRKCFTEFSMQTEAIIFFSKAIVIRCSIFYIIFFLFYFMIYNGIMYSHVRYLIYFDWRLSMKIKIVFMHKIIAVSMAGHYNSSLISIN